MTEGVSSVTLYASRRSWSLAILGSALLIVGPLVAMSSRGASVVGIGLVVAGLALLAGMLFDHPVRTRFDADGITRHCPVRQHQLPWNEVDELRRPSSWRVRSGDSFLGVGARLSDRMRGGLVAVGDGRKVVLCDRLEGRAEYDSLSKLIETHTDGVAMAALRPPADRAPTTLYRRGLRGVVDDGTTAAG